MAGYPEENVSPTAMQQGAGESRDESYPGGRTGPISGSLSMYLPGKGTVTSNRGAAKPPRSAAHCADAMSAVVPGVAVGKVDMKSSG